MATTKMATLWMKGVSLKTYTLIRYSQYLPERMLASTQTIWSATKLHMNDFSSVHSHTQLCNYTIHTAEVSIGHQVR